MSVAFYFDAPVNRAIALGLRIRGVEVLTAQEDDSSRASDEMIMARAIKLNRPVVTTDHDFLVLAKVRQAQGEAFSGVFFLNPQISVGYAVQELEIYAKAGELKDFLNRVVFL